MFDHVALTTGDFDASAAFYEAALAPLGLRRYDAPPEARSAGFGDGEIDLWIGEGGP